MEGVNKAAEKGDKGLKSAAEAIGVPFEALKSKDPVGLLHRLQAAYDSNVDSANRYAAFQKILGDSFERLYPLMQQGVAGLDSIYTAADRSGASISGSLQSALAGTIAASRELSSAFVELSQSVNGAFLALYEHFKPAIDGAIQGFSDLVHNIAAAVQQFTGAAREASATSLALDAIAIAGKAVVTALTLLTSAFEVTAMTAVEAVTQIADIFRGLANVVMAVFKDIAAAAQAALSYLGDTARAVVNSVIDFFGAMGRAVVEVFNYISRAASAVFGAIKSEAGEAAAAVARSFQAITAGMNLANTEAAWKGMTSSMSKDWSAYNAGLVNVAHQTQRTLATIWGEGAKGAAAEGARATPKLKDDEAADKGKKSKKARSPKEGRDEDLDAEIKELEGEVEAAKAAFDEKVALYDHLVKMHQMSEGEKLKATKDAANVEYQTQLALLQEIAKLEESKPQKHAEALNKIQKLEAEHVKQITALDYKAAEDQQKVYDGIAKSISASMSSTIMGLLQHTEKFSGAVRKMAVDVVGAIVKMGTDWVAQIAVSVAKSVATHVLGEQMMTAATSAGVLERLTLASGAAAQGVAVQVAAAIKSITTSSAVAGAGAAAETAPFVGPASVGVGSGVMASVMGMAGSIAAFDVGAWKIDQDQLAIVHKDEMVMTASQGAAFRNVIMSAAAGAGGKGGGATINASPSITVNAMDSRSVSRMFRSNGGVMLKEIARAVQRGAHLGVT